MILTDLPIPPKPDYFGPDGAPPGVELRLDAFGSWAAGRPTIKPRVGVVHTNAASVESTVWGQINWGNAGTNNTKPHYCVNQPTPMKVLRTDKRAIANSTGRDLEKIHGEQDASWWTIAIETADSGYRADPHISDFLYDHAEIVARIMAYESIVHGFPVQVPSEWNGEGWVTHTWPFPYPHFTTAAGKTCPGGKKKRTFREQLIPRAMQLAAAWTSINPRVAETPTALDPYKDEVPEMIPMRVFFTPASDKAQWYTTDGVTAHRLTGSHARALAAAGRLPEAERLTVEQAELFSYVVTAEAAVIGVS